MSRETLIEGGPIDWANLQFKLEALWRGRHQSYCPRILSSIPCNCGIGIMIEQAIDEFKRAAGEK